MTSTEWKEAEEKLKGFYNKVDLNCDGYKITLALERLTQFKNGIVVYIDGKLKVEWLMNDCEERRRFFRPTTRSLLSGKQKEQLKKLKAKNKEMIERKYTSYNGYWTSFKSLKNHLIKNNERIGILNKEDFNE